MDFQVSVTFELQWISIRHLEIQAKRKDLN